MKKIGILTLNGNNNYGNKLQNYALLKILKDLGFDVDTIWFEEAFSVKLKSKIKRIFPLKKKFRRINHFDKFTKNYLNRVYYKNNDISNIYDYFVVGSDQVWNYNFSTFNQNYLLSFSKNINKNISYAASFGVDNIVDEKKYEFIEGLNNFKKISVREDMGKEIIKNLIPNIDVDVVLDPTMLLNDEEWEKVINKPKNFKNKKYIFNYFLGNVSAIRKKQIEDYAKLYDCEIINALDPNDKYYSSGPSEFLYLEKNAFLICTDSFHSCVFAILFSRPFIVFDREDKEVNMNSRIETLLNKFKLQSHKYNNNISYKNLDCDYKEAYKVLEEERKKSKEFLKNALEIGDSD